MDSLSERKKQSLPFEVLLDQKRIAARVAELGQEISRDYADREPILIGVLKGCVVFLADLIRHIDIQMQVEFVSAASYRQGFSQDDTVTLNGGFSVSLRSRHLLLVEGIVDTGKTFLTIVKRLSQLEPASIEIVTLLDKPASHRSRIDMKYKGFSIGNEFVIGYGLDNAQKYRNLPYIGRVIDR